MISINPEYQFDFIALTTAVTRPEVHRFTFPGYIKWFRGARVLWIINIDPVHPERIEETVNLIRTILAEHSNITARIIEAESPCFFSAARRLARLAIKELHRCKTGVLWLEDDWYPIRQGIFKRICKRIVMYSLFGWRKSRFHKTLPDIASAPGAVCRNRDMWFVSLVDNINVSFNPGLWSKQMFKKAIFEPLSSSKHILDPEKLCYPFIRSLDFNLYINGYFRDLGEAWRVYTRHVKWQYPPLKESRDVTYRNGSKEWKKPPEQLRGYVILRGFRGGARKRVLRLEPAKDRSCLELRLIGTPEYSKIYVLPAGSAIELWESPHEWIKPVSSSFRNLSISYGCEGDKPWIKFDQKSKGIEGKPVYLKRRMSAHGFLLALCQSVLYWTFHRWRQVINGLVEHRIFLAGQKTDFEQKKGKWAPDQQVLIRY